MQWGQKRFINATGNQLSVTLDIRLSSNPANNAGKKTFNMAVGQSLMEVYGDQQNPFLNGFELIAYRDGAILAQQRIVVKRGSPLDNQLNMNDTVTFLFANGSFYLQASNTWT